MARLSRSLVALLASAGAFSGAAVTLAQPGQPPPPPGASAPAPTGLPPGAYATFSATATQPATPPTAAPPPTAPPGYPQPPPGQPGQPGAYPYPYGPYPYPYGAYPYPYGSAPPYPYYYPPPNAYPPPAPAPPSPAALAKQKSRRNHDGFYLQMTPGVIFHRGSLTVADTAADASTSGTGFGWDISIGATLTGGFVLAGALGYHDASVTLKNNNTGTEPGTTDLDYTSLSIQLAWYPDVKKGLYVLGAIGTAQFNLDRLQVVDVPTSFGGRQTLFLSSMTGGHFMLGAGYETFVSDEWSIGLQARLEVASLSQETTPKTEASVFTPSLRLGFTYH